MRNQIILASDCLCLPSIDKTESFGLVLLEAMSAGKPCVVSDVIGSGMSWIVDHEETGLVFRNQSAPDLAQALQKLIQDRKLLEEYGRNSRSKYETEFNITKSAKAIVSLYKSE